MDTFLESAKLSFEGAVFKTTLSSGSSNGAVCLLTIFGLDNLLEDLIFPSEL